MRLQVLMAAIRKGPSGTVDRVPSAGMRNKPIGAPLRAIHPNSSPIYKTQSETAITNGLQRLSIKDGKNAPKRLLSGRAGGNGTVRSLADAAQLLQSESVKNVVLVAGAGISTPSGIPDFRSPGTGLYDNLQQYSIPYPEAIFDIDYFHLNPRPFFTLAKELYPSGKYRPNYIHYFAKLLYDKGLLLRMYTQNIDGLERLAGLPPEKLVEAHGTFATATCTICRQKLQGHEIKEKIFSDKLPRCPTRGCVGMIKPDIVFFGEDLPMKFYGYMKDMLQTDMVLVMGTSLEVQPFAGIIDTVRFNVPRVLFNREAVGPFKYSRRTHDIVAAGDLVDEMVKFSTQVGWKEDMVELITRQEGSFTIRTRMPAKGSIRKSPVKQINKPPPAAPASQNRRNNNYRPRATFSLYNDDSSSEESTDSDSDVTSSESSEEDNKRRVFRGNNHYYHNKNNSFQRNGANNSKHGVRSSSAKVNDTNKRSLHSQRIVNSPGGSLTGRSVKSESAINTTLSKRRLDNKKPPLPKDHKNGSRLEPKDREVINKTIHKPVSTEITPISNKPPTQAEKDKVLQKYGLTPLLHNKPKIKSPNENGQQSSEKSTSPVKGEHKLLKTVKSDSAIAGGYFVEDIVKETDDNVKVVDGIAAGKHELEAVMSPRKENTWMRREPGKTEIKPKSILKNSLLGLPRNEQFDTDALRKSPDYLPQVKEISNHGLADIGVLEVKTADDPRTQKPDRLMENTNGQACIETGSVTNGTRNKQLGNTPEPTSGDKPNGTIKRKGKKPMAWQDEDNSADRILHMLDTLHPHHQGAHSTRSSPNIGASRNSQNSNDKGSKKLSDKVAKSFAKYANLTTHRVVGKFGKKERGKGHRITLKDKPSAGPRRSKKKTELNSLNPVPYGYDRKQSNKVKGVGPFHRINVRTLNSSIDYRSDEPLRSGSADIPKISYRHSRPSPPKVDAPTLNQKVLLSSPDQTEALLHNDS